MYSKRNRQRNIELPSNIWSGGDPHVLRDDEELCEECGGRGGHSESDKKDGLIQMCNQCLGKGYRDWIERAKGPEDKYGYFISHTGDKSVSVVDMDAIEIFKKKIELQVTGEFKFINKDEI